MSKTKKKKGKKESNPKLILAASVCLIFLILFCFVDTFRNHINGSLGGTIFMSVIMGGSIIILVLFVWQTIKRLKSGK